MLELGRYRLASVLTGTFAVDGGAMFGVVPRPLWERQVAPDAQNRIRVAARALLVVDGQSRRRILVDAGVGEGGDERRRTLLDLRARSIDEELARHGLARADITDVVLSHLHFDHAGGTARRGPDGVPELSFPNATHHLQRRAWQWAHAPSERDAGDFARESYALLEHSSRLHLLEGETELFPGIELIVSEGHTVGQQLVRVHGGGTHLTFCGDVIPTRAHLRTSWVMAFDLYPLTSIEEKKMILAQALEEDGILFFEHDAEVAACRLGERDGQPVFRESVEL